jgi:hypothetical protein
MLRKLAIVSILFFFFHSAYGQSPEFSLREFASGQIKKGVRSIGMGGDGATWGNYALVYKDSSTALLDAGATVYSNNNSFNFTAVGVTLPPLKNGLVIYAIALAQTATNISTTLKFPGAGVVPDAVRGDGNNQAVFVKMAMPLGKGFSGGILLSYERSGFDAHSIQTTDQYVNYQTRWVPSGGFGLTWQPSKRILIGFRGLFNNDKEVRTDNIGSASGANNTQEYRLGISVGLWQGALADIGENIRHRSNALYNTSGTATEPNLGFEQNLWRKHVALRFGLDETSGTAGFSLRFRPIIIDVAYVYKLAAERVGAIFGATSNSILFTGVFDFGNFKRH